MGNNLVCRGNTRMRYHRILCYETVLELVFDDGNVIKSIDHSKKLMKYHICMESALREYVHNARKLIFAVFGADAKYDISDMPPPSFRVSIQKINFGYRKWNEEF